MLLWTGDTLLSCQWQLPPAHLTSPPGLLSLLQAWMPDSCIGVATLAKCSLQQLQSICSGRSFSAGSAGHSVGVEAESGRPSLASAASTSASDAALQPRTAAEAESAGETGPGALPAGGTMPPPPGGSSGGVVADLAAKLELLEDAGVPRDGAVQRYAPFLCSPTHHIAVRLAFLAARGKLRRPPRLWQVGLGAASRGCTGPCVAAVLIAGYPFRQPSAHTRTSAALPASALQAICPGDQELCSLHGERLEDLAAFRQQHLASPAWRAFCERHGVDQAQPEGRA